MISSSSPSTAHLVRTHEQQQAHGLLDGLVGDGSRSEWRDTTALLEGVVSLRHRLRIDPPLCVCGNTSVGSGGSSALQGVRQHSARAASDHS